MWGCENRLDLDRSLDNFQPSLRDLIMFADPTKD
jgi:hypothetical protein